MEAIINSISQRTLQQYSAYLKRWWEYCISENVSPYVYNLSFIIKFLNSRFVEGTSYASINSCKSALSLILNIREEDQKYLKRFLKGIYNQRPSAPRYEATWDTYPVLQYIENLHPLESLNLYQLSLKLITLMALTTGHRIQTFSKININDINISQTEVVITVPERIKTSKLNMLEPKLQFPFFRDKPELCVASTILFYIKKTSEIRPKNESNLIITIKKPHRAATSQTLSRWLKEVLQLSGIDTNLYKGYSFRHAATSAAFRQAGQINRKLSIGFITGQLTQKKPL